ncbi:MAG TPA: cytochrome c3 family protein [Kofleriaceae bacterium]|nr:cytochrome c3 family protein [Kofleriaceae bacterium]
MKILIIALVAACSAHTPAPSQPIAFDHALHLRVHLDDRALACTDCHAGAERAAKAGLPAITTCLRCHMRPQGDRPSAKERRVRELAATGGVRWIQVTRNPGHVYFSHRAHVSIAKPKLACDGCHGAVASWTAPPTEPNPSLTSMDACLACHRAHGAPTDCGVCHR